MINLNPNIASLNPLNQPQTVNAVTDDKTAAFRKTVDTIKQQISNVDGLQKEADQFGLVTVEKNGGILLEMAFLDEDAPGGLRRTPAVRLK